MDRLRDLKRVGLIALLLLGAACEDDAPQGPAPSRFASVKGERAVKAAESFCEHQFPASGSGARTWAAPAERPVPGKPAFVKEPGAGWTWVNLWASWCGPCIKEMPLLGRWGETLRKDGVPVRFEFWSVDESEEELRGALKRTIPGQVRWLASAEDLPGFLESLGIDKNSAIPVHALVDRAGMVRCVRVGSVSEDAFGTVKAILAGG